MTSRGRMLFRASLAVAASLSLLAETSLLGVASPLSSATATTSTPKAAGELDCNGHSPIQQVLRSAMACTDIRGFANVDNANNWSSRFWDNGTYIGHDEPDMTFLSSAPGSGDNVTWTETLGSDPAGAPTVTSPGSDVSHWFELSPAPWFSMTMCDPLSYPQLPCTPNSDANAPSSTFEGAGAAFMELQFYPPGFAPFVNAVSCDNAHWCAAMTIDSLACTFQFATCNNNCIEPVNFAFISTDGVPAGPPSPQLASLATFTPNSHTLLMNPGDRLQVHMFDAPVPHGGGSAFEVTVKDLTTGQRGSMQASAANGFQNTSITNCAGTPFNFEPEYNTASAANIAPWTALQTDISTQYEIGHFEPCSSVVRPTTIGLAPGISDTYWNTCKGAYENTAATDNKRQAETSDAPCYPAGDTHGVLNTAPDTVTGCLQFYTQNGDLDFEGSPYWTEWPTSTTPTSLYPASFVQALPVTAGKQYPQFFFQTDVALSESTCVSGGSGCAVPPPNAPGGFYPYWDRVDNGFTCSIEFGNVSSQRGSHIYGGDAQYGTDQFSTLGYDEFEGPVQSNTCT